MSTIPETPPTLPHQTYLQIFKRFLRFGLLAWGGPFAQIAMIRQELVEEEHWISRKHFNRILAVYQVLPGPEAHELCVYFGMVAGGRIGGMLAGLGFMLPGFILMFALSWFYVTYGIHSPIVTAVLYGCKAAVIALIVRAIQRIGEHTLTDRGLWVIALAAAVLTWFKVDFLIALSFAGVAYALHKGQSLKLLAIPVLSILLSWLARQTELLFPALPVSGTMLFGYGLRTGLLTFGGAYTAIPFLQHDAVVSGAWMSNPQFLDGLALSGILPAPLIIFATFVGYLGNGTNGALAITSGVFLPAFAFTLIGHTYVEKLVANQSTHIFLDGVTAGVIGLIAVTAVNLFRTAVVDLPTGAIFALALLAIYRIKAKTSVVWVMLGAGLLGWVLFRG
jgi:chromate transporter